MKGEMCVVGIEILYISECCRMNDGNVKIDKEN